MNELAIAVVNIIAFTVVVLLMFVVTQATKDLHLRRNDSAEVKASRKNSFYSAAAFLIIALIFQDYWLIHPAVVPVAVVVAGMLAGSGWILAVSLVSMKSRAPPEHGFTAVPSRRLRSMLTVFRRH